MYKNAIKSCVLNATRLLDDGVALYEMDRYNSAYMLVVLAQEESAKVFLLNLIDENIIPWTKEIKKALRNHECKHLIGELMFYLNPEFDITLERSKMALSDFKPLPLPKNILDIIDYFRYEKIERWISPRWWWGEDPGYDKNIKQIGEGKIERAKQDATYCSIGIGGGVQAAQVCKESLEEQISRARQMLEIADGKLILSFREYKSVRQTFIVVFRSLFEKENIISGG